MVLCFTFKSMLYLKLIFVKDMKFKFFAFFFLPLNILLCLSQLMFFELDNVFYFSGSMCIK